MIINLASASPRRAEVLSQLGIEFNQFSVDIDESINSGEVPERYLNRITSLKLKAAVEDDRNNCALPTLVADTIVTKGSLIFGKPIDYDQAEKYLLALSDSWHKVMSCCLIKYNGKIIKKTRETWVKFRKLNRDVIKKYWQSGEPQDKAGAYAIQGKGATFVEKIEGSYSGVVGLDIFDVSNMLSELGLDVFCEESSYGLRAASQSRDFNKYNAS